MCFCLLVSAHRMCVSVCLLTHIVCASVCLSAHTLCVFLFVCAHTEHSHPGHQCPLHCVSPTKGRNFSRRQMFALHLRHIMGEGRAGQLLPLNIMGSQLLQLHLGVNIETCGNIYCMHFIKHNTSEGNNTKYWTVEESTMFGCDT